MLERRKVLNLLAVSAVVACAPRLTTNDIVPVWVRVVPTSSGYQIRVDDEEVELVDLEVTLLDRAVAVNPRLTREQARQEVRIYLSSEPGMATDFVEDLMPILRRFGRVGIVAEDRRS